jgi:malate synthase
MDRAFLKAYVDLLIKKCHRRGIHAMGGMAAQIPIKNDPKGNEAALEKVRQDKLREVKAGHDGTWVAHPALVPVAKEIFDRHMPQANQISVKREDVNISPRDLLITPSGDITEEGVRLNVDVGIRYLEAWLRGNGAVPIYNLMEDAATAEISRAQVWQWLRHGARLSDGRNVTADLIQRIISEELQKLTEQAAAAKLDSGKLGLAAQLFEQMMTGGEFPEFMTLVAYSYLD